MKIEQLFSMDGYTFDEGIAFLRLCNTPLGVVQHIASTHNRNNLHSEIHKALRLPDTMRLLREKGFFKEQEPKTPVSQPAAEKTEETKVETPAKGNEDEQTTNDDQEAEKPSNGSPADHSQPAADDKGEISPNPLETSPENPADSGETPVTFLDLDHHRNTRFEEMPNKTTQELWLKKQERYREMQQYHLKMRKVPEGKEHDAERKQYRDKVISLSDEIKNLWSLIDAEIQRIEDKKKQPEKVEEKGTFKETTCRSYISKMLGKKMPLSDEDRLKLQHRVEELLEHGLEISEATAKKLIKAGVDLPQ